MEEKLLSVYGNIQQIVFIFKRFIEINRKAYWDARDAAAVLQGCDVKFFQGLSRVNKSPLDKWKKGRACLPGSPQREITCQWHLVMI
jgi:hypothetical protein